jgi:thiol:disulfide interchange protein DsbA
MKRFWTIAIAWFAVAVLPQAHAVELYQAGHDYYVLESRQPVETGDKVELREFFHYACPHCYKLETPLNAYVKNLPANARFVRTAAAWGKALSQAFHTFEEMGITEKAHSALFDAIHAQKQNIQDEVEIANVLAKHGMNKAKFLQVYGSPEVQARFERSKELQMSAGIQGVPVILVDGKYIVASDILGDDPKKAFNIVDFLIRKAAMERKAKPKA